jgi:hypothetical protein
MNMKGTVGKGKAHKILLAVRGEVHKSNKVCHRKAREMPK